MLNGKAQKLLVTSTYKLDQEEEQEVLKGLGLESFEEVVLENVVDPDILGGLIIRFGPYFLDYSLKTKLREITESLNT